MVFTLGPGIVVAGSVVGTGELINTPVQAARFGFVLLWAVIIACLIKYFLQVEIGRHCLVHDRTALESLKRFPGPKLCGTSWILWIFIVAWTFGQIGSAGIVGALAGMLHGLLPLASEGHERQSVQIWSVLVVLGTLLVVWRSLYGHLEKLVVVLVGAFSASVVIGLIILQGTEYRVGAEDVASGLTFSLGEKSPKLAAYAVISLLGGLGVAGLELFVYPYWVREKYARLLGPRDSEGWLDRARGWVRMLQFDAGMATLLATVITAAYFLLGAAVLFRLGQEPKGIEVVDRISGIFTQTYGGWSRGVFLVGAFCTMFSTLVISPMASGRIYTDFLCTVGLLDRNRPRAVHRSHQVFQTLFLVGVLTLALLVPERPEMLVILSQYIIGLFGTPLAMVAICWMAFHTDRRLRMHWLTAVFLLGSVLVLATCLIFGFAVERGWIE
jgi:Mn2+/Fe2+ NRAMP family transporter